MLILYMVFFVVCKKQITHALSAITGIIPGIPQECMPIVDSYMYVFTQSVLEHEGKPTISATCSNHFGALGFERKASLVCYYIAYTLR